MAQPPRFPSAPMRPFGNQQNFMGTPGAPAPQRPVFSSAGQMSGVPMGGQQPMRYSSMPMNALPAGKSKDKVDKVKGKKEKEKDKEGGTSGRPGVPTALQNALETRKRPQVDRMNHPNRNKKKPKIADKILSQKVRQLVPESQAYMDLLAFERKLDATIARKRLDMQEALKRPMKQKRKLRIFISNTFNPGRQDAEGGEETGPWWELRVEGRLLDENAEGSKPKQKFSTFFKSLVIELDKELYGPDNHLVEWHRTPKTSETDGFQVKRAGDQNVKCTVLLMLDYNPLKYKLDPRLAHVLGIHTESRPQIINALWQYIKQHKLQDPTEREFVNCDRFLAQIFETPRLKFAELPARLHNLLMPPDPIVINHTIVVEGPDAAKKAAAYDVEIEVDDPKKAQMNAFMMSPQNQQEIAANDTKIHDTVEQINNLKTSREFYLSFADNPQEFITNWLISQTRDLKTMTDVVGNPEQERKAEFYYKPSIQEGVSRYFYNKVQQRKAEIDHALGFKH
ncbi:SWI/SNF-related matrix-associated actin-dependent regulator of chromatin subfamily D member 1-like [Watersipora subatra]|uniref:SWI/SNF-related matrix-associated actin-dependent regulator of chromatin subfamily D member 1-like n=1 Tax=Watersipora subatra TaxID=2589382 RepID=UPI00355C2C1F